MSTTSSTAAWASSATRMLATSTSHRLNSAGLPAPSTMTRSTSDAKERNAASIRGHKWAARPRQAVRLSSWSTWPSTTTWLRVLASGFTSTGFIRTSGSTRAARAWRYCAVAISPPRTTRALLAILRALKGATRMPRRAKLRARAVVTRLFPAELDAPWIISALIAGAPGAQRPGRRR